MKSSTKRKYKYFREYKWSNVFAMIRNNQRKPQVCLQDSKNKLVVITGATSGIGYSVAHKFASMGANLLCINRSAEKSEKLKSELESQYGIECDYLLADLSNLSQIHRTAEALIQLETPIDVLIHNAGVFLTTRELTDDGIERTFAVQYLASFILNYRLSDKLSKQEHARIIMVNSEGHRFAVWGVNTDDLNWDKRRYSGLKSYGSAKLSQLLTMHIFAQKFENTAVSINAMHPGAVKTETGQENGKLYRWYKKYILDKLLLSADISAEAIYYLAISDQVAQTTDTFFNLTTKEEPAPPALDIEMAQKLWKISIKLAKLD